jgi:hypothetical protein
MFETGEPGRVFIAQYYELTLRVRAQDGKWMVAVLGPYGLLINGHRNFESRGEAELAAIGLAQRNLHEEKRDTRPVLDALVWQPS